MKPSSFEYIRPKTVDEALASLDRAGDEGKLLSGGQSLIPMMNLRMVQPEVLIDIGRLEELDFIRVEGDELVIGAMTCHNTVLHSPQVAEHCPLIAEGYQFVAHHAIRNRGTLGGSLSHHDPASEMPLVATLMDAVLVIRSIEGERRVPAADFFVDTFETILEPNEILTEIRFPCQAAEEGFGFDEVSQRKGDYAIVAVGCRFSVSRGACKNVRFGVVGVGTDIKRILAAEQALEGQPANQESFSKAIDAAVQHARPDADIHADIPYKLELIEVLANRVLSAAAKRAS